MKAKESDGRLKVQIFVKQGPDDVPHYWGLQVKSPHGHQAARQRLKDVLSQRRHAAAAV
jgi:hypothetical protein